MTAPADLTPTRLALHAVAEHVIAAGRYAATGRIGLVAVPHGFATPPFPTDRGGHRTIAVVGAEVVVRDERGDRSAPVTTLRAAADLCEVTPGAPPLYPPATALDLDAALSIEPTAARRISSAFALGDAALTAIAGDLVNDLTDGPPPEITLWPEHFDLATSVDWGGGEGLNLGVSPGDATHPLPYLYVGPWTMRPGGFWNESFGASRSVDVDTTVDAALAFFRAGLARARDESARP